VAFWLNMVDWLIIRAGNWADGQVGRYLDGYVTVEIGHGTRVQSSLDASFLARSCGWAGTFPPRRFVYSRPSQREQNPDEHALQSSSLGRSIRTRTSVLFPGRHPLHEISSYIQSIRYSARSPQPSQGG
jgi:hypothetical protein